MGDIVKSQTLPSPVRVDADIRKRYTAIIEIARVTESSDPAANRHPWQCEIAVTQLTEFAITKQHQLKSRGASDHVTVQVRTDSLPLRVYGGEVADRLKEFLELGGELCILLTESDSNHDVSSLLQFASLSRVSIRQEQPGLNVIKNHYFLVDEQAYRFEAEHSSFTGDEFREGDDFHPVIPARICFNDPKGATTLKSLFDLLWLNAKDILPALRERSLRRERGPNKQSKSSTVVS